MIPSVKSTKRTAPDQSVICLMGKDGILPDLKLSVTENEYIKRSMADRKGIITVNSFYKITILVRENEKLEDEE